MAWSDYWNALSGCQRTGLSIGAVLIVATSAVLAVWLLHDPYVPLASGLNPERVQEIAEELERAKIDYRIDASGDAVAVSRSQLGKARSAMAAGPFELPRSVGLELFEHADFSATDFAQRINYQRALQGEIARTIEKMAGVRSARVHVILSDGGLLKRNVTKASAAVSVTPQPGATLSRAQVAGIQRLIAASVPQIEVDDVVVLDEQGQSLTQRRDVASTSLSSARLDLKREADQYFEAKLERLLRQLLPESVASWSVDATLDERQLQVTTETPVAAAGGKDASRAAGVLVRERQSQHGNPSGFTQTDNNADEADSRDWEYEYKVGNRIEQILSAPGSIKRISVAVALRGVPTEFTADAIQELVSRAVGVDATRGDAVSVLLLPRQPAPAVQVRSPEQRKVVRTTSVRPGVDPHSLLFWAGVTVASLIAGACLFVFMRRAARRAQRRVEDEAVLAKVREWLQGGASNGRI